MPNIHSKPVKPACYRASDKLQKPVRRNALRRENAAIRCLIQETHANEHGEEPAALKIFSANIFSMFAATLAHLPVVRQFLKELGYELEANHKCDMWKMYVARRTLLEKYTRALEERLAAHKLQYYFAKLKDTRPPVVCFQEMPRIINDAAKNPDMVTTDDELRKKFIHMLIRLGYETQYDGRGALVAVDKARFKIIAKRTVIIISRRMHVPIIYARRISSGKVFCFGSVHVPHNISRNPVLLKNMKRAVEEYHLTDLDVAKELVFNCVERPQSYNLAGDFNSAPPDTVGPDCVTGGPVPADNSAIDRLLSWGSDVPTMKPEVVVPLVKNKLPSQHIVANGYLDRIKNKIRFGLGNSSVTRDKVRHELLLNFVEQYMSHLPEKTKSDHASVGFVATA